MVDLGPYIAFEMPYFVFLDTRPSQYGIISSSFKLEICVKTFMNWSQGDDFALAKSPKPPS